MERAFTAVEIRHRLQSKARRVLTRLKSATRDIPETIRNRPFVTLFIPTSTVILFLIGTFNPTATGPIAGAVIATVLTYVIQQEARKRDVNKELIERVLGPAYSEIRRAKELLVLWKTEGKDLAVSTPFLKQVQSDWRYYTLADDLRTELEWFQISLTVLEEQRAVSKSFATSILQVAASELFGVKNVSTIYLWRSHSWKDGQIQGENGRMPTWELVIDSAPLGSSVGYYVHSLQVVNHDSKQEYSLPLLNSKKEPLNASEFETFWELARARATTQEAIVGFRDLWSKANTLCSDLERKLDLSIKRLR